MNNNRQIRYVFVAALTAVLSLTFSPGLSLAIEPDEYEVDDAYGQANVIVIADKEAQAHNFHDARDQDWVEFYGRSGLVYSILATNVGSNCDTVIELYDTDGETKLAEKDDAGEGEAEYELLEYTFSQDGVYYMTFG